MRIDSLSKLEQVYKSQTMQKKVQKTKSTEKDCIQISNIGRDMQIAKKAVKEAEDIRFDKVEDIKNRMKSGTYNVSSEEVADKMVSSLFEHLI